MERSAMVPGAPDGYAIRPAAAADGDEIAALLAAAALPVVGVAEHMATFAVAVAGGRVVGAIGIEPYGETALLRSAVVDAARRNTGIGAALYEAMLDSARARGVSRLVLLTTTAVDYFARRGFQVIDRASLAGPVTMSAEFQGACPESAVCMALGLR